MGPKTHFQHINFFNFFFRFIEKNGNFQRISRCPMNVHAKNQVNMFAISYVALMWHYEKHHRALAKC